MPFLSRPYLLLFCLLSFWPFAVAQSGEALDFVQEKIDELDSLREELTEANTASQKKKVRRKALKIALDTIDIKEITRLSLGKHYKKLGKKRVRQFQELFHQIVSERIMYASLPVSQNSTQKNKKKKTKPKKLAKIPIKLLGDSTRKDSIFAKDAHVVRTQVKNKKVLYDIDIHLFKNDSEFHLYDIHVDEASILLDFKNQFARIIKTKGFKHLLQKMRKQASKFSR